MSFLNKVFHHFSNSRTPGFYWSSSSRPPSLQGSIEASSGTLRHRSAREQRRGTTSRTFNRVFCSGTFFRRSTGQSWSLFDLEPCNRAEKGSTVLCREQLSMSSIRIIIASVGSSSRRRTSHGEQSEACVCCQWWSRTCFTALHHKSFKVLCAKMF